NDYRARFHHKLAGDQITEPAGGGLQRDGAGGVQGGSQLTGNLRRADFEAGRPAKPVFRRDDQVRRGQAAFDFGGGINRQRLFGDEPAVEFSLEDDFAGDGFGVEDIAPGFEQEPA